MEIIKVFIVDDHVIFRKGLSAILNQVDQVKVVGEASNGKEFLEKMSRGFADIVFMDIKMPEMDGIEATKELVRQFPETKVIALTMFEEISYFNKMIEAGASGFLLKKTNSDELEKAMAAVLNDDSYFSEEFMSSVNKYMKPRKPDSLVKLSEREMEVLELISKGLSNVEIAKMLGLSQRTVDGHRARLLEKTGAKNAANLVMYALKNGLVNL